MASGLGERRLPDHAHGQEPGASRCAAISRECSADLLERLFPVEVLAAGQEPDLEALQIHHRDLPTASALSSALSRRSEPSCQVVAVQRVVEARASGVGLVARFGAGATSPAARPPPWGAGRRRWRRTWPRPGPPAARPPRTSTVMSSTSARTCIANGLFLATPPMPMTPSMRMPSDAEALDDGPRSESGRLDQGAIDPRRVASQADPGDRALEPLVGVRRPAPVQPVERDHRAGLRRDAPRPPSRARG